jgi:hypothetical protein
MIENLLSEQVRDVAIEAQVLTYLRLTKLGLVTHLTQGFMSSFQDSMTFLIDPGLRSLTLTPTWAVIFRHFVASSKCYDAFKVSFKAQRAAILQPRPPFADAHSDLGCNIPPLCGFEQMLRCF